MSARQGRAGTAGTAIRAGDEASARAAVLDLEGRLRHALELADRALVAFGANGYVDTERPEFSFPGRKVVAEAAMLAYAAYGLSPDPQLQAGVRRLVERIVPRLRTHRVLGELATHPDTVFHHAVPHVLISRMGAADAAFDAIIAERCARMLRQADDLPATAHRERRWIAELWQRDDVPVLDDSACATFAEREVDVLAASRDDAYAITHQLFYLTDFGRRAAQTGRPVAAILTDLDALLARFVDHEDYDLCGELLMAWPQLGADWSATARFAFDVLLAVEDEVGLLPCGNVDLDRLDALRGPEQVRYALAGSYHTAIVMGLLCAVTLRAGLPAAQPADQADWRPYRAAVADRGHWLARFDGLDERDRRRLAGTVCDIAVSQSVRTGDYRALVGLLDHAEAAGLGDRPSVAGARDRVSALAHAAAVAELMG